MEKGKRANMVKQKKKNTKHGYGTGKNNWYRFPGKAIGKGSINYNGYSEDDYWSAWGYEDEYWNNHNEENDYGNYYIGNAAMMLETSNTCLEIEDS